MIRRYGASYLYKYGRAVTAVTRAVLRDLLRCRTAALGGHRLTCVNCAREEISYNSCRNRHCPKCGGSQSRQWLDKQVQNLLPVPYFHIVFTMPQEIAHIALQNRRLVYGLLFRAASQTLLTLAADPKHLGARIGVTAVLHTWGQNLGHHPHVHCIVPGGGLSKDRHHWVSCRNNFFISVRVMRALFRGKFLALLRQAYECGDLEFHGRISHLRQLGAFRRYLKPLSKKKWVVYAKAPLGGPEIVLKYLARYTHRVAISNHRILNIDNGRVVFRWKDYRDGQPKVMSLDALAFLRRFTLHILPKGFVRIRHYGILANCVRIETLKQCRNLLPDAVISADTTPNDEPSEKRCDKCNGIVWIVKHLDPVDVPDFFTVLKIWMDSS